MELSTALLSSNYLEEKEFGIKILQKNHKILKLDDIKTISTYFKKNYVHNWATCDSLSGKVIHELIKANNVDVISEIHTWKNSDNLWQQRASCVSFVKTARFGTNKDKIMDICSTCVKSPERFVQLGNGWLLRELSLYDLELVVNFIKENYQNFSREGLRYAIEKMNNSLRNSLLSYSPASGKKEKNSKKRNSESNDKEIIKTKKIRKK